MTHQILQDPQGHHQAHLALASQAVVLLAVQVVQDHQVQVIKTWDEWKGQTDMGISPGVWSLFVDLACTTITMDIEIQGEAVAMTATEMCTTLDRVVMPLVGGPISTIPMGVAAGGSTIGIPGTKGVAGMEGHHPDIEAPLPTGHCPM